MSKKIFITRSIPEKGIKLLKKKKYQIKISPYDRVLSKNEIIKMGKGCDALLCLLTDKIDGEVLDKIGPQLKIVANYAVGIDNIDLVACKKRGVKVSNTPGVLTTSVAEHTFALIMAIAKRIVEADYFMREGKYVGWEPKLLLGTELRGKKIGVIGLGRIGKDVVRMAYDAFGMEIYYNDLLPDKKFEKRFKAKKMSLEMLLKKSDFVSIHVPLLPSTRHLINSKNIKLMKKTAYLINTSRGPVIEEKSLYNALEKNKIKGAAIDVFECEPKLVCRSITLKKVRKLKNLVITPHIASASIEAREEMSEIAAKNIVACLSGKKLVTPVKL